MTTGRPPHADAQRECEGCALVERRAFLREAGVVLAGVVAALGGSPARAAALSLEFVRALGRAGDELTYPIPAEDGAQIDKDNQVITVRYQQKAYAFNLACPHQNTAVRWQSEDNQFQCPKHHSRYRPDGVFISGRATRGMDRFAVRKDGGKLVVNVSKFYKQDEDGSQWDAAFVTL
ncbi:MAG: Rieske 2Fe-2S domain-containing protein [Gemmatimonadales bacterium]|jgi:nitrite reductase/ring-hydroxylating ferredoxin subunit